MRFTFAESMTDPANYLPLARACEEAGWDSMMVPDSIGYTEESDSTYPYTPDGSRDFLEDKPFIEPFVLIPALGAVTERLRFTTFVVKLPIREPVLVAKQASSIAVLTDNRFALGVGISPWPEDFEIMNVPWARRGKRMNEMLDIIRGLTDGGYFEYHGEIFDLQSIKITPVPTKPLPLMIGGQSEPALKRAARQGDGWMHAGGSPEELAEYISRLGELRKEYERDHLPFEIHVISLDAYSLEGIEKLEAAGVTDCIVGFRDPYTTDFDTQSLEEKVAAIGQFAEDVISQSR